MKLETSQELLERVRARHGSSWYGLARLLPASVSSVANWKNGRSTIDRKFVTRVAELLDESPEYVLLCLEAEREPSADLRKVWQRIAAKFRSHAASILLASVGLLGVGSPAPSHAERAAQDQAQRIGIYIMRTWRRRRARDRRRLQKLNFIQWCTV
jgi:transcriptional regulator with XRE-family HTH domain